MSKKVALIVGGNGGIGSAIAGKMVGKAIKVYSSCYKKKNGEQHTLLNSLKMDVTDELSVHNALDKILKEQKIDIVVFSASAHVENKQLMMLKWDDFSKHLDVQIKGLLNILHALKDQIKAKHKTKFIIILTEYCIGKPPAALSHYVSAKYALMGLAKSMAVELAKYNCTVNMVSPGM
ncbi:MAG: SDR family oxidoreductase, partial [bacterium]